MMVDGVIFVSAMGSTVIAIRLMALWRTWYDAMDVSYRWLGCVVFYMLNYLFIASLGCFCVIMQMDKTHALFACCFYSLTLFFFWLILLICCLPPHYEALGQVPPEIPI